MLDSRKLIAAVCEAFGIKATTSSAGLVAMRLIEQMGGPQNCRVFKIEGVRKLIRRFSPTKHFTRSAATAQILNVDIPTGTRQFEEYKDLWIEGKRVTTVGVFTFLVEKGLFRPGLALRCPICELEFWLQLDDVQTESRCEYCGKQFNISPQLKDRDWHYRRSGLFGRDDNQGGGVPVAITLQQIDTALNNRLIAFAAGTELHAVSDEIEDCESDLVVLASPEGHLDDTPVITIGECKALGEIEEEDVRKLSRLADALEGSRECKVYILFAKTGEFSPAEVARCRAAQPRYRCRVILLSKRELEPYWMFERAAEQFQGVPTHIMSFEEMATATNATYFQPVPKQRPDLPPGVPADGANARPAEEE